jgi:undecaprenyl-diphosphatase
LTGLVFGGWSPLHRLDGRITDRAHAYAVEHPGWVRVNSLWTDVFAPNPLRVAVLLLAVWLFRRHATRLVAWVAVVMVVGGLSGPLVKLAVGRERPDLLDPVAAAPGYAFPSGHALNATLAAGVLLVVLLPATRGRPGRRAALWGAAVALAGLTGATRIALGVHWTSDVLAGWLLGVAVLSAALVALPLKGTDFPADSAGATTDATRANDRPAGGDATVPHGTDVPATATTDVAGATDRPAGEEAGTPGRASGPGPG